MSSLAAEIVPPGGDLESVDLVLRMIELLAASRAPRGVTDVARALAISKPRAHRHLRALVQRGWASQDARSEGYEIGIRLVAVGEAARERFDVLRAIRPVMEPLRAATGLAVSASALVGDEVIVLEVLQGATLIDFAVRPGSRMDLHASAHGLVTLAFGPGRLMAHAVAGPMRRWTDRTIGDPGALELMVRRVRMQGWAVAPDAVQIGVNALAAPVRDHHGIARGAVALVGATQFIPARPSAEQVAQVTAAAAAASRTLGWIEQG